MFFSMWDGDGSWFMMVLKLNLQVLPLSHPVVTCCNHMSIQDTLRGSKRSIHVWNRLDSIKLDYQIDKDMNVRNICTHIT
jgi:hypothetical protein